MAGLIQKTALLAGGVAAAAAVNRWRREQNAVDFKGKVVLITGGSRGLGLGLAEALAREGASLAICARNRDDLEGARLRLRALGADVLAETCDVGNQEDVERLVERVKEHYGHIDMLFNVAGIIFVSPLANHSIEDFRTSMDTMFWGVVYPTLAVSPDMVERGSGNIVNITSISGKLSVPHLTAYSSAKFAAVGFSEGLTAELAGTGVHVTTVVPGLMRTGSYRNARFKGQYEHEYTWFGLGASLPVLTISVPTAVERILKAVRRGDAVALLDLKTHLATRIHALMPDTAVSAFGLVNRIMPAATRDDDHDRPGHACETSLTDSFVTTLGKQAAERYNQI